MVMLSAALCLGFVSCGDDDPAEPNNQEQNNSQTPDNQTPDNNQNNQGNQNNQNSDNNTENNNSNPGNEDNKNEDDKPAESKEVSAKLKVDELGAYLDKASEDKVYTITITDMTNDNQETLKNLWGKKGTWGGWSANEKYDKLNVNFIIATNEGLTSLQSFVFDYCGAMLSIEIPTCITRINSSALSECKKLKSLTFHEGITYFDNHIATKNTSMTEIVFKGKVESIGHYVFDEGAENVIMKVPAEHLDYYKASKIATEHDNITIEAIAE